MNKVGQLPNIKTYRLQSWHLLSLTCVFANRLRPREYRVHVVVSIQACRAIIYRYVCIHADYVVICLHSAE